mmetsp:Transcript_19621/g.30248  ORF Transcript_19621/g.30248 Transcript_19621/m.30248 type:complete len:755 (-) Transcript_19621:44-2308(-)
MVRFEHRQHHGSSSTGKPNNQKITQFVGIGCAVTILVALAWTSSISSSSSSYASSSSSRGISTSSVVSLTSVPRRLHGPKVKVFSGITQDSTTTSQTEQQQRMAISSGSTTDSHNNNMMETVMLTPSQQRHYLTTNVGSSPWDSRKLVARYDELVADHHGHLAQELWKYVALYQHGGLYLDAESPLMPPLPVFLSEYANVNVAVYSEKSFPKALQGSLLLLQDSNSPIAQQMVELILTTPTQTLQSNPLLIPTTLYSLVENHNEDDDSQKKKNDWTFLEQRCTIDPVLKQKQTPRFMGVKHQTYLSHYCPKESKYCCQVQDPQKNHAIFMTSTPLLPYQILPPPSELPKPYNLQEEYPAEDLPYISTIEAKVIARPDQPPATPNLFDTLAKNDCLPSSQQCSLCLRNKQGATLESCKKQCPCYSKTLCKEEVVPKHVSRELVVTPPLYKRDPSRLIPRIVHQTWFEDVTAEKYPNMYRLINSWKLSGWEYKFYDDNASKRFLERHFPPEVKDAYDSLVPGAFKADLFRYCVLLIHGGIYADMDVMLESNLDVSIGPDVGFMVPRDEPGNQVGKQMCAWNGLLAAAPGHSILANAIQNVVNNARNRFTSVDMDNMFCPNPELSILHAFDTLFTAGPCILGATINEVMGRNRQTQFEPGTLPDPQHKLFPGRAIILNQNKWDMGAHRFTLLEENMVVAATDMPDYEDRPVSDKKHYSETHARVGVYGLEGLYVNKHKANEDIRILVKEEPNTNSKL